MDIKQYKKVKHEGHTSHSYIHNDREIRVTDGIYV